MSAGSFFIGYLTGYMYTRYNVGKNNYVAQSATGLLSTSAFNLVVCWFTTVDNTLNVQVNNGTIYSAACIQPPGGNRLAISNPFGGSDCAVDEFSFWNGTVLDSTQRTTLYNSGAGRTLNGAIWS